MLSGPPAATQLVIVQASMLVQYGLIQLPAHYYVCGRIPTRTLPSILNVVNCRTHLLKDVLSLSTDFFRYTGEVTRGSPNGIIKGESSC